MEYSEITMTQAIFFLVLLAATILSYGFYCVKKEQKLKAVKPIKNMAVKSESHSDKNVSLLVA